MKRVFCGLLGLYLAFAGFALEPLPSKFVVGDMPDDAGGIFQIEFDRSSLEVIYLNVLGGIDPKTLLDKYNAPVEKAYLRSLAGEDPAAIIKDYPNEPIIKSAFSGEVVQNYYSQYKAATDARQRPAAYPFVTGYQVTRVDWFKDTLVREVNRASNDVDKAKASLATLEKIYQQTSSVELKEVLDKTSKAYDSAKARHTKLSAMFEAYKGGQKEPSEADLAYLFADATYLRTHTSGAPILSPSEVPKNGVVSKLGNDLGSTPTVMDSKEWKEEVTHIKLTVAVFRGGFDMPSYFRLEITGPDGGSILDDAGKNLGFVAGDEKSGIKGVAAGNWFNMSRLNVLIAALIFSALVLYFIYTAKKGKTLFLRRIAGLDHVEEAIGRATEMGKPILYISGLSTADDISTIAAMTILGRVATKAAQYDTPLIVPCYDPIVMMVEQEIVKESYTEAGRPDAFKEDSIFFVTNSQFGYVAAVDGIMMREKPATNFYMGYYFAEALILAETGAATGAIQIAGTDATTQLPFFITSCDYCLMGEELYAAGAYLGREPKLLGSIKGQDWSKFIAALFILVGTLLAAAGITVIADLFNAQ